MQRMKLFCSFLVIMCGGCLGAETPTEEDQGDDGTSDIGDLPTGQLTQEDIVGPNLGFCSNDANSPLVIDIQGDNYALTTAANGVYFDIDSNGIKEKIAWTATGAMDGFLVLDRNQNGKIDNGGELFGNGTRQAVPGGFVPNGYNALANYDTNHDGVIDVWDPVWKDLFVWVDFNHDGIYQSNTEKYYLSNYLEYVPFACSPQCIPTGYFQTVPAGSKIVGIERIHLDYAMDYNWTDSMGNKYWYRNRTKVDPTCLAAGTPSGPSTCNRNGYWNVNSYIWDIYFASYVPNHVVGLGGINGGLGIYACAGGGGAGTGTGGAPPAQGTGTWWDVFAGIDPPGPWPAYGCAIDVFITPRYPSNQTSIDVCAGILDPIFLQPTGSHPWISPTNPLTFILRVMEGTSPTAPVDVLGTPGFLFWSGWMVKAIPSVWLRAAEKKWNNDDWPKYSAWCIQTDRNGIGSVQVPYIAGCVDSRALNQDGAFVNLWSDLLHLHDYWGR